MFQRSIDTLKKDLNTNSYRYHALTALFLLVYFGEVLLSARLLHQLSSVERQFWGWWFLATTLQLMPIGWSFGMLWILIGALLVALTLGWSLAADLALWIFYLLVTILIANLVSAWRDR